jgi:plastocyanin
LNARPTRLAPAALLRLTLLAVLPAMFAGMAGAGDVTVTLRTPGGVPLESAVAWLTPVEGTLPAPPAAPVVVDQRSRRFVPLVTVIQRGTRVEFPNSDDIRHSVYSFSDARPFQLKLYSGRPAAPLDFPRSGVVTLGCNIHDQMIAWIVVVDSAWFGRSDATGAVVLRGVPAGRYRLQAWHPGQDVAPEERAVTVATAPTTAAIVLDAAELSTLLPDTEGHSMSGAGHPARPVR